MPYFRACPCLVRFFSLVLLSLLVFGISVPAARANWLFSNPPNQVTLDSGKRNQVFIAGDPVVFSLTVSNYGTYALQGSIRYEVRDYWGNIVQQGSAAAPTPLASSLLSLPAVTQPGWYKLYLHQPASVAPWGDSIGGTMFVIFRPNANFPAEPSETLPYNSGGSDGGDEVARGVLGMGPQRHPVQDVSQPAAAMAQIDPAVAQDKLYYTPFDPQRSRPLLIAFPNGIYASDPAQQSSNLTGLRTLVTHYHNDIKYWEPRNEPNYAYSGADYVNKELKPFYQTIKSVDPSCKVLGPAVVTIGPGGLSWIEDFLKAGGGNYIDAFSFHAYNNVNGDLTLARQSLDALNGLLNKYGVGNIEKWQTEQGYFAAVYGAYQPRLQGRWTMLQMMVYEQYGIPKEHNHLWYDKSHGFWDFPAFWENEDGLYSYGSFDPAAPLMRVWSEELYGTNFTSAYNLGALGNKLYVGSLFSGSGKSVAAFQSAGRTDGSLTLNVSSGSSVHVVSAFGVAQDLPVTSGQVILPVPELPVYVEMAAGQTVQPVPLDYGPDLALTPGTVATSSGNGLSPLDPTYPNDIGKVINGTLENWYWSQGPGDHPWMGNDAALPGWVQITLPQPMSISHAVVYAGVPWQSDSSLLDYEFQYDQNGQWVTLSHPTEPTNVVDFFTPSVFCTADTFYSDRDVFVHDFAPVTTQKIRLLVHDVTWGGGAASDIVAAGGQTGPHQITLREIELYGPAGQVMPPTPSPPPPTNSGGAIRFYPRPGSANRMQGGKFQGSTNGVTYTDLYTISGIPADSQWTTVTLSADPKTYRYLRYLSPNGGWGNVSEIEFYSGAGAASVKLTGTPFGSPGSYNNNGSTFDKAFDGNTNTCFDGPSPNGNFTGIDQGGQVAPPPVVPPTTGTGTGLTGQYFNGTDLSALTATRVDPTVNFNWNGAAPDPTLSGTLFSVRWTGQVQPLYSEAYTFSTVSDDGVRVWVNGQEIINNWTDHAPTTDNGTLTLTAGQKYDIKVEYYQRYGGATAQLSWHSPSQAAQIIPQSQLYPAVIAAPSATGTVRFYPRPGSANRMTGGHFQGSTDGVTYTDLGVIATQPADAQWTSLALSVDPKTYRYLRYLSPNGSYGNVAEVEFDSGTGASAVKLTGTPFGTSGSYNNSGATFDKAFDSNVSTYFDAPTPNGNFTGIDQGGPTVPPVTPPALSPVYQINVGGGAAGAFAADGYVQGGGTYAVSALIDTSAAANPAPQAVYQSERYGSFTYSLPGLTPGGTYTLRLHFAEIYWNSAGQRLFSVAVNGQQVLSNFDIFAAAGGENKAITKTFTTTADSSGTVTVVFATQKDNAKLSGLELLH